jgi:hypothetical protein
MVVVCRSEDRSVEVDFSVGLWVLVCSCVATCKFTSIRQGQIRPLNNESDARAHTHTMFINLAHLLCSAAFGLYDLTHTSNSSPWTGQYVWSLYMVTNSFTCYASKDICFLDAVRCNIITFKLRNGLPMATRRMPLHAKHTGLLFDRFIWSPTALLATRHRTNCFLDAVRRNVFTFKLRNGLPMATRRMPLHAKHTGPLF